MWKQTIAEFEAANPGIKIEPVLVARKDHWTKFVAAAQAKKAPCIVSVDLTTAAYNGYLMPLDKYWNAEPADFRKRVERRDAVRREVEGPALRPADLGRHVRGDLQPRPRRPRPGSIPPSRRRTLDEYIAWAKKLTGNDQWATAVLGGKTDTTTRVLLMWIWANGGEAFNADMTEATFAKNPKSLEAIKFYLGLRQGRRRRARADHHQLPRADEPVRAGQDRDDAQRLLGDRQGRRRQPGDEGQDVRGARSREHAQCADARDA